jgi:hypothetical protein
MGMTPGGRPAWPRWSAGALAWALWLLTVLGLAATAWFDHLLGQAGRPELVQLNAGGVPLVLSALSAATAGAVLASHLAVLASTTFVPGLGLIGFILLLTPTGALPSARRRSWAWIAAALPVAFGVSWLLGMPGLDPDSPLRGVTSPATALTMVVAAVSLVRRFARGRGTERQQLPLAIGAAIARYRLYDLDRIISRTLAYALLTLLLGLGYAGVVLGPGRLLPQGSSLVVAGATLAVAAMFQPARRRSSRRSTGASTAAATTPPRSSPPSALASASRLIWPP